LVSACGAAGDEPAAATVASADDDNAASAAAPAESSVSATVTVNRRVTAGRLDARFVGLSYEKSHLTDAFFTGHNAPLIALFRLLGPGILRIGGNAVDRTTWQANAMPVPPGTISTAVGTADVDNLAAFLTASGWRAIYGVNLKTSPPALNAEEATFAAHALGANLYAVEIGNEIDHFHLPYATARQHWEAAASAITASAPVVALAGPATGSNHNFRAWTVPFAHDEAGRLAVLTQHYYRGSGQSPSSTMDELLAPDPGLTTILQALAAATSAEHTPHGYRLGEANSFFHHGAPGVSDAFGSALWAIDFLFLSAQNGASGVHFHGGGPGQDGPSGFVYTPIDELDSAVIGAKPIFYGLLLVTRAGSGNLLSTVVNAGKLNFTAYTVEQTDGSTNLVLVNKDAKTAVVATVDVGTAVSSASGQRLRGPSLGATSGVTLAGAAISPTGQWSPQPPEALPVSGHVVTVTVAPASAVLVHAQ
jgi:hypothetical protein